ncbi:hypothetical protein JF66_04010 [Cryobacterium sp. MLB-32]|uniref:hypothetical protein n=1 Tax=Cryobacterium sp. MLB-32 TaxID=1529318 RepID=UPI0004E60DF5|nr:hypothetical protein [Cryobacterium sp. MLB-32]KFF60522.1 hypothetical protein JF66_04010 [Cryobacterium sp. MLB-32]
MKLSRAALGALVLSAALALSGCAAGASSDAAGAPAPTSTAESNATECAGVAVVIDYGTLDSPTVTDCVDASGAVAATEVLTTAGIATEGSVEWGDQIVCRVNDRPGPEETVEVEGEASFTESCAAMPPAYAYWSLWVKPAATADWEYAQEGLGTLQSTPGQSVGLRFTTGTETPTPGS